MTLKELVLKVVEQIKTEHLITQEDIDKSTNDGSIDLAKLSEAVSAEVMAKVNSMIVAETTKQEADAIKKAEDARIADLEKREKKVKEDESKIAEMAKAGAAPIIAKFPDRGESSSDVEMRDAIIDARNGKKTTLESDLDVAHGNDVVEQIKMNRNKADFDAAAGYGIEWVPEARGTDLYVRLQNVGNSIHGRFRKKNMTSRTQKINELLTQTTMYGYSGNQTADKALESVTASALGTADLTLTAKSIVAKSNIYNDVAEDSIIATIKEHKNDHAIQASVALDDATINGDTSSPHMDCDTEDVSQDVKKLWKGLRYYFLTGSLSSDWSSGGLSLANMDKLPVLMGKYALDPKTKNQVFWLLGTKGYNSLRALSDYKTAEKAGVNKMTLINGQVEKYMGYDVLFNSLVREDLDADGYYDTVTSGQVSTKGSVILVNPTQFIYGLRKKLQTIVAPKPEDDKIIIVSKLRVDFSPFETPSSTIASGAIGYNYAA